MLTPIEQAIEKLNCHPNVWYDEQSLMSCISVEHVEQMLRELLPTEKQVIEDAYYAGFVDADNHLIQNDLYYSETFNK